jgi:hypothetical protein
VPLPDVVRAVATLDRLCGQATRGRGLGRQIVRSAPEAPLETTRELWAGRSDLDRAIVAAPLRRGHDPVRQPTQPATELVDPGRHTAQQPDLEPRLPDPTHRGHVLLERPREDHRRPSERRCPARGRGLHQGAPLARV